jgi:hypothetical protein
VGEACSACGSPKAQVPAAQALERNAVRSTTSASIDSAVATSQASFSPIRRAERRCTIAQRLA